MKFLTINRFITGRQAQQGDFINVIESKGHLSQRKQSNLFGFTVSVVGHGIFLLCLLEMKLSGFSNETKLLNKAIVKAALYFPPKVNDPDIVRDNKEPKLIVPEPITPAPETIREKDVAVEEKKQPASTEKNERVMPAFDPMKALQSLQQNVERSNLKYNQELGYQDYVNSKNYILRSSTKLDEIPEAKPVQVNVNCDNAFSKSLTILSNIMGGSVKCQRFNGAQKFIDARLENLGKKKNGQKKTDD